MCKLTIKDQILKGRTMKIITLLICLLFSFSMNAASADEEAELINAIKKMDQMLNGEKPLILKSGKKVTKKEVIKDRKRLMEVLEERGGVDKKERITWSCVNKVTGWTKYNTPESSCKRKRDDSEEDCAIKAGEAKTDSAANLIYRKCETNVKNTFDICMERIKGQYEGVEPKVNKCIDQAYLEN